MAKPFQLLVGRETAAASQEPVVLDPPVASTDKRHGTSFI